MQGLTGESIRSSIAAFAGFTVKVRLGVTAERTFHWHVKDLVTSKFTNPTFLFGIILIA